MQTTISQYPRVAIFQFEIYDINKDEFVKSQRWATEETINNIRGRILKDTQRSVDESVLKKGFTDIGFIPD